MKNEPVFPSVLKWLVPRGFKPGIDPEPKPFEYFSGLTKREYFAGQALFAHLWLNRNVKNPDPKAEMIAMDAVACADALIAELEKANE